MTGTDFDLLARAAARLETDPRYIAFALAKVRDEHGYDAHQLAALLKMGDPRDLVRLALCRRPVDIGEQYEGQLSVIRLAERYGCDPEALAELLVSA